MQDAAAAGNVRRASTRANMWDRWKVYCAAFGIDPLLKAFADPVPFMSTFVVQYRLGTVAARGKPVRARQAEDAIRLVGETMELMGVGDKRYVPLRPGAPQKLRIDPRLSTCGSIGNWPTLRQAASSQSLCACSTRRKLSPMPRTRQRHWPPRA